MTRGVDGEHMGTPVSGDAAVAGVAVDPWLALPLSGVRLIEASAGTGKTYTLATLVTRLVVERGLRVGHILAVTFTEAATQELRRRIRERLQRALELVDAPPQPDESGEAALTRQLLHRHRQHSGESRDALRHRLRQAVMEMDLAAIFTIHGFCARVLREHALESGHGFDPPELLGNDRALREGLAADLWRALAADAAGAEDLAALWKEGPVALAQDLPMLLREPVLLPARTVSAGNAAAMLEQARGHLSQAGDGLRQAWSAHGETFFDALVAAIEADVMNRNSYKAEWVHDVRQWLRAWAEGPERTGALHDKLVKLRAEDLLAGTKKAHAGKTPSSPPLSAAVTGYLEAVRADDAARVARRIALLQRLREDAHARMVALKRQQRVQSYDDLIDGVADVLAGPQGAALVAALRAQYQVALVDEFQDTDARQWDIFARVFGDGTHEGAEPALFLVGDPKQAIYGFRGGDVHTYLAARARAEAAPPLASNFRSRPSVLAAVDALYARAGDAAFVDPRIGFRSVAPGGKRVDADFMRGGQPAPALTVWRAPPPPAVENGRGVSAWPAEASRERATAACVAAIHAVLTEARAGTALLRGRPVQPGDIAVLVRTHTEATRIQHALGAVGIPAVAAGKQSLLASREARELHALLLALLHTADEGRLRTALCTVLVGVDAAGVDALEQDPAAQDGWQQEALRWRERLTRGGPLALVADLCAAQAPRLLSLVDGERRLSNYLQLAELLQEAQAEALGLQGLVDGLARRIATADEGDEAQMLRLESDARRVQIVTLHKSKGLEYPLVFLPFAGIGGKPPATGRACVVHDPADGRCLHWVGLLPEGEQKAVKEAQRWEQQAEDARLLYVGLTRAEHALWLAAGPFYQHARSLLAPMLSGPDVWDALAAVPGVRVDDVPPPALLPRLPPASTAAVPPPRTATRALNYDWWVYSFTQLAQAEAGRDPSSAATLPGGNGRDEPVASTEPDPDPRFSGTRFGVALHAVLEHADFAAWRAWQPGDAVPADEAAALVGAMAAHGYTADVLDDGVAFTTALVGHTLTVALPERLRLCDLPAEERRAEIEFQFALQPTRVDALLRLLHAHGVVRERSGFGQRQRLEGLMTGLIDLTYRHDGRWYVLDYKSNRLPGYDDASLAQAMAHSEYDLQALIYTVALHRWLRFRLGDGYDYRRDFGGVRYVFCRGLDAAQADSPGIRAWRFEWALVQAVDELFGAGGAA